MATFSKFYQVTNQMLLEYKSDQYKITTLYSDSGGETSETVYMYQSGDGKQYCVEKHNIPNIVLNSSSSGECYYPGTSFNDFNIYNTQDNLYGSEIIVNGTNYGTVIKDITDNHNQIRQVQVNNDKIRIYLISGYVMNAIAGINIKVHAHVSQVQKEAKKKRINDDIIVLNWFMPKEQLKDKINWLKSPLYLNSKFYDRYIEISFPSPYDLGLNMRNIDFVYEDVVDEKNNIIDIYRGQVNPYSDIIVDFSTVQPENFTLTNKTNTTGEGTFTIDKPRSFALKMESNSNYFNVRMKVDEETNTIVYYPVYGDDRTATDMNLDKMLAIETGNIPMMDYSEIDQANEGMDDFIEMYGDETFRWVIINELAVTYFYDYIVNPDVPNSKVTRTEYFTNTIDYTGKTKEHGQFWRSRFIPTPEKILNMTLSSISVKYTAHLYNRMNNMDIIKTCSMILPGKQFVERNKKVELHNVITYKVVNKINKIENTPVNITKPEVKEKYMRSYYDVTDLVVKDVQTGQMYTQGKMTLRLKHSSSNYMLKLYTLNNANTRIPYDLTGTTTYKLVFPTIQGTEIEIYPNQDSDAMNLSLGTIVFYITKDIAARIMQVPDSERYFSLMSYYNDNRQESTLYEGKVDWYN